MTTMYVLKLFIYGESEDCKLAISNLRKILDDTIPDSYELSVIDIQNLPEEAEKYRLIAIPTLIKTTPFPPRRLIGTFSDREKVITALDLFD